MVFRGVKRAEKIEVVCRERSEGELLLIKEEKTLRNYELSCLLFFERMQIATQENREK